MKSYRQVNAIEDVLYFIWHMVFRLCSEWRIADIFGSKSRSVELVVSHATVLQSLKSLKSLLAFDSNYFIHAIKH